MATLDTFNQIKKKNKNRFIVDYMNKLNKSISYTLSKTMHSQQVERQNKNLVKTYSETLAKSKDNYKNFNHKINLKDSGHDFSEGTASLYSERIMSSNDSILCTSQNMSENQFTNGSTTNSSCGKRESYCDLNDPKPLMDNKEFEQDHDHSFKFQDEENTYDQWMEQNNKNHCTCEKNFKAANSLIVEIINCYESLSNQLNEYLKANHKLKIYYAQLNEKVNYLCSRMNVLEDKSDQYCNIIETLK